MFETLTKVLKIEQSPLILLIIVILLLLHFTLQLVQDVIVALDITSRARIRHTILIESLILSHLLHPSEVS